MSFHISILGSNAAVPAFGRNMCSQLLNIRENHFLIDCAEGTQHQFLKYGFKSQKINHVFISHLHGDHIFGLPGFLLSMSMNSRKEKLTIFSPPGLKLFLETAFSVSRSYLTYEIEYRENFPDSLNHIFENEDLSVHSFPLSHSIPCQGFIFREKELPQKMIKEKIVEYSIPYRDIDAIKKGKDWTDHLGKTISNSELTCAPSPSKSYAFCSDTIYCDNIIPFISEVDMLYHEATFSHDLLALAVKTGHSTALQAAELAKRAKVKKLLLGHFSTRYPNPKCLLDEAKTIFSQSELAVDGKVYSIE
jgi:ribonuclease Z